jgi:hypothetical protein
MNRANRVLMSLVASTCLALGLCLLVLASQAPSEVTATTSEVHRGGAPITCFTAQLNNCQGNTTHCDDVQCISCYGGAIRCCPNGTVELRPTTNNYNLCNIDQPTGYKVCSTAPPCNNGIVTCSEQSPCITPWGGCWWEPTVQQYRCSSSDPPNFTPYDQRCTAQLSGTCP